MAKYYLDNKEFDTYAEYAKAVKAKNKQIQEQRRKILEEDARQQVAGVTAQQNGKQQGGPTPSSAQPNTDNTVAGAFKQDTPDYIKSSSQQPQKSGLKQSFDDRLANAQSKVENSTTYKQGQTIKKWNDQNKAYNKEKNNILGDTSLGDADKAAKLKKLKELKKDNNKKSLKEGLNNMKFVQNIQKQIEALKAQISAIISNIEVIAIVLAVIIVVYNVAMVAIGVFACYGDSPHFWCNLEASRKEQQSAFYQQYCTYHGGLELTELNGHYIIQDGSGPCTACCTMNLLLRYFAANGVNMYDYLWDENGNAVYTEFPDNSINADDWYHYLSTAYGSIYIQSDNSSNSRHAGETGSWIEFARSHGDLLAGGWENIPNWGFYYSEDIWDLGTTAYDAGIQFQPSWTWDIDGYGSLGPGVWARWYVNTGATNGKSITLDGVTATFVFVSGTPSSQNELIALLQSHPSGVAFCAQGHGMLLTRYEDGIFYMVDSGLGRAGGWEGPCTDPAFCCKDSTTIINPSNWNGYWYIEEDTATAVS